MIETLPNIFHNVGTVFQLYPVENVAQLASEPRDLRRISADRLAQLVTARYTIHGASSWSPATASTNSREALIRSCSIYMNYVIEVAVEQGFLWFFKDYEEELITSDFWADFADVYTGFKVEVENLGIRLYPEPVQTEVLEPIAWVEWAEEVMELFENGEDDSSMEPFDLTDMFNEEFEDFDPCDPLGERRASLAC